MDKYVKIECKNCNRTIEAEMGISLLELSQKLNLNNPRPYLVASVNHRVKDLNYRVYTPAVVEFFDITSSAGFRTYDQNHSDKQFFPLSDLQKSNNIITNSKQNLNLPTSNMQQNNIQPQKNYNGAQNNQQIPILESEEECLKRLRRQRQRKGFF